MTNTYIVIGALALVAVIALNARHRRRASTGVETPEVRLSDIPSIFARVAATRKDGSFAVLLFGETGRPPAEKDALNVQFSIEGGRVGLDWVLLAPLNVAARQKVTAFFAERRIPLTEHTMNGVSYLRTESGDLPSLCRDLLRDVFGVTDGQLMFLIPEGFTWERSAADASS
jgi:hypothetical protein